MANPQPAESHPPDEQSRRDSQKATAREISANLIRLRKKAGLSQRELSEISGVSKSTINALESGQATGVMVATVKALAAALHIGLGGLLDFGQLADVPKRINGRKHHDGSLALGFGPDLARR